MNAGENSLQKAESLCKTKGNHLLLVLLIRTKNSRFLLQERFTGIDSLMVRADTPWSRSCREGAVSTTGVFLRTWLDKYGENGWDIVKDYYLVMSLSASLSRALCSSSSHFSVYFYSFFFFLPSIASLLFSLSLASTGNGVISWAEATLAANCPCNRREPVGRSKSEEARCCLKPVT